MTQIPHDDPIERSHLEVTRDEVANAVTHGLGFVLSLAAIAYFWQVTAGQELGLRVTSLIFAATMASVYLCSTLSHAVHELQARRRMRAWDQGTIYLLIAGTYSPFVWQGSPAGWTAVLMAAIWSAACWGFYVKVFANYRLDTVSTVTYVLLGWLPSIPLFANTPTICTTWMLLGGLSYTFGILFLISSHRAWFAHSLWHIAVILGSLCHCIAISHLIALA